MSLRKQNNKENGGNGKRRMTETNISQASKLRRVCAGVRKELFKSQGSSQKKKQHNNGSGMNWSPESCRRYLQNLPSLENSSKESANWVNPLEKKIIKNESPEKKTVSKDFKDTIKIQTTPQPKSIYELKCTDYKSPDTSNYLKLEKICENSSENKESPVSAVCSLLENNMLLNSGKKVVPQYKKDRGNIIEEIKILLRKDQDEFEETSLKIKEMFDVMQKNHQDNYEKIKVLIETLDDSDPNNSLSMENCSPMKRRSLRLKKRSPINRTGSPVILKAGDLRKSTLTKSLVTKCQKYQIDSPRIQNAISMYNTTRNACSALLTPRILKNEHAESPKSSNWRKNLSLKVQQQCLLLQDTPKHN